MSVSEMLSLLMLAHLDAEQDGLALKLNPKEILWGRITLVLFEELLPLLSLSQRKSVSELLGQSSEPNYVAMMVAVSCLPEHLPYLLFRLSTRLEDCVDCAPETYVSIRAELRMLAVSASDEMREEIGHG